MENVCAAGRDQGQTPAKIRNSHEEGQMNRLWVSWSALALLTAASLSAPSFLDAQSGAAIKPKTPAKLDTKAASTKPWTMPRLPDGRPDLHGYWTNLSFTPMERPAKYQGREFLTEKEMQEVYKAGLQVTYEGESVEGIEGFGELYNPASVDYDVTTYALSPWQNGEGKPPRRL
jgi:hypothetical protein